VSTLPDLYERRGAHGDHAGADAVVARAISAAHDRPAPVPLTFDAPPRRGRRATLVLTAAVLTLALIAVPVALRRSSTPSRASVQPPGPPYPPVASATATQLTAMRWSQIAKAPIRLTGTTNQLVAWAGNELIVFGEDTRHEDGHGAGAAYVPATNRWHLLPRAPLRGDWFFPIGSVWTGRELVVFPATLPDVGRPQGEAYSPRTNSWRVLAPAPLCSVAEPGIVWTGHTIVLAGGWDVNGSQCSDARSALTASYDPLTDRWTPGPRVPERPGDRLVETKLVWAGGRVVAVVGTQRNGGGTATAGTTPTSAPTPKSTVAAPLSASDPVVRVYSWTPGTSAWNALGDLTAGTAGEAPLDHWDPSANGSRITFPPSLRFCGEGNMAACSNAGVQPGSAYDLDTGHRVALALPKLAFGSNVDATAFTAQALVAMMHDSSTNSALVWDLTTGRRAELPRPPGLVLVSVWTGREVIALAVPSGQGDAIGFRLGP
jgi:hypothetical protein